MKKIFAILLILCFVLTGCTVETTNSASLTNTSSNLSYSAIFSETQKTENVSNVIISSKSNNTEETIGQNNRGAICESVEYHANFKTMNEFVKWAKKGGEENPAWNESKDNPCSAFFLNWRKSKNKMVVPRLENNDFELKYIQADDNRMFFRYYIKKNVKKTTIHNRFHIFAIPLTEQQKEASLVQLTDLISPSIMITKENVQGKWGNYCVGKHLESKMPCVWFVNSSMLYLVNAINFDDENEQGEWQDEYFDYFDFETVSLK